MPSRIFLTLAEVIEGHRILIEEFGGSHGIRDQAALEAAVFRPQIGYYDNLVEEAAALMESLANNHAFIDGNKRISFAATDAFLRINGSYLEVESAGAHMFMMEHIASSTFRFGLIRDWISANLQVLKEQA